MPENPEYPDIVPDNEDPNFKPRNRVSGDIRDLYAYYRLGDHELTHIKLRDKVYDPKDERDIVYFEGHMRWVFLRCLFKKEFYFGVEGQKLREDDRGTPENPEPFPPYGHNGVRFEDCTFEKTFEIKQDSIVQFKNCTFLESVEDVIIEDRVKAEFVGCTFKNTQLKIGDFCELKVRDTTWDQSSDGRGFLWIYDQTTAQLTGVQGSDPQEFWLKIDNGSKVDLFNNDVLEGNQQPALIVDNGSHMRVFNSQGFVCDQSNAVDVLNGSKLECYNLSSITSQQGKALRVENSECLLKDVDSVLSENSEGIFGSSALIRGFDVTSISSTQSKAISLESGSELFLENGSSITSSQGVALYVKGSNSKIHGYSSISSGQGTASDFSDSGESFLSDISSISSGQGIAVKVNGAAVYASNISTISSGNGIAISLNDATYEDKTGNTRSSGNSLAVDGDSSRISFYDIQSITSGNSIACNLKSCICDFRDLGTIEGLQGGALFEDVIGFISEVDTITSSQGIALEWNGASKPVEVVNITTIEGNIQIGAKIYGEHDHTRISGVDTIKSGVEDGCVFEPSSGTILLENIGTISSEVKRAFVGNIGAPCYAKLAGINSITSSLDTAFSCTISGFLEAVDIDSITSEIADATNINCTNGEIKWNNTSSITSQIGQAFVINGTGSFIQFQGVGSVSSEQDKAANITLSDSNFFYRDFTSITSEQEDALALDAGNGRCVFHTGDSITSSEAKAITINGQAECDILFRGISDISAEKSDVITGSCEGSLLLKEIDSITSQEGVVVNIQGNSNPDSRIMIEDISDMSSQKPPDDMIEINQAYFISLKRISSISAEQASRYAVYLQGIGSGNGLIEVIDCTDVSVQEGAGGVFCRDAETSVVKNLSEKGKISVQKSSGGAGALGFFSTGAYVRNWSELSVEEGPAPGFYCFNNAFKDAVVFIGQVDKISGGEAASVDIFNGYEVTLVGVEEISGDKTTKGLTARGVAKLHIKNGSDTTKMKIGSKDKTTEALDINGDGNYKPFVILEGVETQSSKGKVNISHCNLTVLNSDFKGETVFEHVRGSLHKSQLTVSCKALESDLKFIDTDIKLGTDEGDIKNIDVSDSTFYFSRGQISGSEQVTFNSSICDFLLADSLGGASEFWTINDSIINGKKITYSNDWKLSSTASVLDLRKTTGTNIKPETSGNVLNLMDYTGEGIDGQTAAKTTILGEKVTLSDNFKLGDTTSILFLNTEASGGENYVRFNSSLLFNNATLSGDLELLGPSSFTWLGSGSPYSSANTLNVRGSTLFQGITVTGAADFGIVEGQAIFNGVDFEGMLTFEGPGSAIFGNGISVGGNAELGSSTLFVNRGEFQNVNCVTSGGGTPSPSGILVNAASFSTLTSNREKDGFLFNSADLGTLEIQGNNPLGVIFNRCEGTISIQPDEMGILSLATDNILLDGASCGVIAAASDTLELTGDNSGLITASGSDHAISGGESGLITAGADTIDYSGSKSGLVSAGSTNLETSVVDSSTGAIISGGGGTQASGEGIVQAGGQFTTITGKGIISSSGTIGTLLGAGSSKGIVAVANDGGAISCAGGGVVGAGLYSTTFSSLLDVGIVAAKLSAGAAMTIPNGSGLVGADVSGPSMTVNGSAIASGLQAQSTGSGKAIMLIDQDRVPLLDTTGTYSPRTGINIYNDSLALFNNVASCGIRLGAQTDDRSGADVMARSATYIYDLADEIHHNIPEEGPPV